MKRPMSLEEQKKVMLEILDDIDHFCKEEGIQYFLLGGTLLGAIRHKGFIPWDDDVDICLKRNDYIRFISEYKKQQDKYDVLCCEFDNDYFLPQAKICDKKTILDEKVPGMNPTGVYIDVFPLDYCPGNYDEACSFANKPKLYRDILTVKNLAFSNKRKITKNIELALLKASTCFISRSSLANKINNVLSFYADSKEMHYLAEATLMPYGNREVYKKEWFEQSVNVEFEGRILPAPVGYDSILSQNFNNYMELPPIEKRAVPHGSGWWKE